jgi:hypothetical protein
MAKIAKLVGIVKRVGDEGAQGQPQAFVPWHTTTVQFMDQGQEGTSQPAFGIRGQEGLPRCPQYFAGLFRSSKNGKRTLEVCMQK